MERRDFLQAATLATSAMAGGTATGRAVTPILEPAPGGSTALAVEPAAPRTRRWIEQRWAIDNIIRANGIDWDQPRSIYLNAPCGVEANADFAAIRARVGKMADIGPAFESTARRRETKARAAEAEDALVTARDNWFMAAIHYGAAQWPYDENNAANVALNAKKRDCFAQYARLADHTVEAAWVPFGGKALPAWFHLPPNYRGGRIPVVVAIPGMDGFKEGAVALYGDRWLNRGMAVLAVDGPGEYEAPMLGIPVTMDNWVATGKAVMDWLVARPEVDATKVAITGTSFGSFFATIAAANEPRFAAVAVISTCLEPGCQTIFQEASPTFKQRFMYMAAIPDEARFDAFRQTLTWHGHAERLHMPYLCIAGESDELSPLEYAEQLMHALPDPRALVIYQDSRHAVGSVPAANLGPSPGTLMADWVAARLAGKPFANDRWFVDATGRVTKTPLG